MKILTREPGGERFSERCSGGESNKQAKEGRSEPGEKQERPVGKEEGSCQILSAEVSQTQGREVEPALNRAIAL